MNTIKCLLKKVVIVCCSGVNENSSLLDAFSLPKLSSFCKPSVNEKIGVGAIPKTLPFLISWEGFDIGRDSLSPMSLNYQDMGEVAFSGKLERRCWKLSKNGLGGCSKIGM